MTEKDKKLIAAAMNCDYTDFDKIDENAADTEEAREILHNRAVELYHMEEAIYGLI